MISPVSSASVQYAAQAAQSSPAPAPKAAAPQDTVQLSHAARAAAGDADHDGDSH